MLVIKKLLLEYREEDVREMTKLNPYRFTKLDKVASSYSKEQLEELLDNFINLEISFKTNYIPEIYKIFKAKIITFM